MHIAVVSFSFMCFVVFSYKLISLTEVISLRKAGDKQTHSQNLPPLPLSIGTGMGDSGKIQYRTRKVWFWLNDVACLDSMCGKSTRFVKPLCIGVIP